MRGLLASPLGYLIGVSLGALGGGGSILAVPALVYAAGQSPQAATTTSLLIVGLASLSAMRVHRRAGNVRVKAGLGFTAVGIGGSLVGNRLNHAVDPDLLLLAFAALMVVAAQRMWASTRKAEPVARSLGAAALVEPPGLAIGSPDRLAAAAKLVAAGTVVGFLTGFFGVGGGFVIVPALVLALKFPMPEAVGTSLLIIAANAAVALSQRIGTTGIDWAVAVPFTVAALAGARHGTRLADRFPARTLARAFVAVLIVIAVYVAISAGLALS